MTAADFYLRRRPVTVVGSQKAIVGMCELAHTSSWVGGVVQSLPLGARSGCQLAKPLAALAAQSAQLGIDPWPVGRCRGQSIEKVGQAYFSGRERC